MHAVSLNDRMLIHTIVRSIIDEINSIVAISFSIADCHVIIITIEPDIAHVAKSEFNEIICYGLRVRIYIEFIVVLFIDFILSLFQSSIFESILLSEFFKV